MSPSEKLTAAAERIEQLLAYVANTSPIPWAADKDDWCVEDAAHFSVGELATPAEAELTVSAVNAMPALAAWLTCAGEDLATDADAAGKDEEAYTENVPYRRLVIALADQILGGE